MPKILIIEDDQDLALVLSRNLRSAKFDVVLAYDGIQATRAAHQEKPDLIMLDLNLPGGGGLSTLQNLKLSTNTATIPVVVLTGSDKEDVIQLARDEGIRDLIKKPYDPTDLIARLKNILNIT